MTKYILNQKGKDLLKQYDDFSFLAKKFGFSDKIEDCRHAGDEREDYDIAEALGIINAEGPGTIEDIRDQVGLWNELQPYLEKI